VAVRPAEVDYYYMRLYAGIAAYRLGHYTQAVKELSLAAKFNKSDIVYYYQALSYAALGRSEDERAVSRIHTKKLVRTVSAAYGYRQAASTIGESMDKVHQPQQFGMIRSTGFVGALSFTQAAQYYHQVLRLPPSSPDAPFEDLPVTQVQYFARGDYRYNRSFSSSLGYHQLYAYYDSSSHWHSAYYAECTYHHRLGEMGVYGIYANLVDTPQWQTGIRMQLLPKGGYGLYLRGHAAWQYQENLQTFIAEGAIGARVLPRCWLEVSGIVPFFYTPKLPNVAPLIVNFFTNRGEYIYNALDPSYWKVATSLIVAPKGPFSYTLGYQYEYKEFLFTQSPYAQQGITIGITWSR